MSFLKFTGVTYKLDDGESFEFKMSDGHNLIEYSMIELPSPIYDNSFKNIFGNKKNITKSFLNSIMYPSDKRIIDVTFLPTNLPGDITQLYSEGSIIADVLCKCIVDEGNGKHKVIIIDLEMQINFSKENTKRFISYLKKLNKYYSDYCIIVLALVFRDAINPYENMGTKTLIDQKKLISEDDIIVNTFDEFQIYQIDICYCYKSIFYDKKDINIFPNQIIREEGKEWIKFLNLPNWCEFFTEDFYAFPPLGSISYVDPEVKHALKMLEDQKNPRYEQYLEDKKKMEEKEKLFKQVIKENEMLKNRNIVLEQKVEELTKKQKKKK